MKPLAVFWCFSRGNERGLYFIPITFEGEATYRTKNGLPKPFHFGAYLFGVQKHCRIAFGSRTLDIVRYHRATSNVWFELGVLDEGTTVKLGTLNRIAIYDLKRHKFIEAQKSHIRKIERLVAFLLRTVMLKSDLRQSFFEKAGNLTQDPDTIHVLTLQIDAFLNTPADRCIEDAINLLYDLHLKGFLRQYTYLNVDSGDSNSSLAILPQQPLVIVSVLFQLILSEKVFHGHVGRMPPIQFVFNEQTSPSEPGLWISQATKALGEILTKENDEESLSFNKLLASPHSDEPINVTPIRHRSDYKLSTPNATPSTLARSENQSPYCTIGGMGGSGECRDTPDLLSPASVILISPIREEEDFLTQGLKIDLCTCFCTHRSTSP